MNRLEVCTKAAVLSLALAIGWTVTARAYTKSPYKWALGPVLVYVNPANRDVTTSAAEGAVKSALNTWTTRLGGAFRYQYGGRTTTTSKSLRGRNVVIFRNASNGGAVASTYTSYAAGVRVDSDIIFWDGKYRFYTGTSGCSMGSVHRGHCDP